MSRRRHPSAWYAVWIAALVLAVLHQDVWFWNDRSLVLGFIPIGLAYHMGYSIAAGLLWAAAVRFAWPAHIEAWADELDDATPAGREQS